VLDLIKALTILAKYTDARNPTGCEHDEFRVYVTPSVVSDEDKAALDVLGFIPHERCDAFLSYRYGSA
jgi:hypothetical protein